MAKRGRSRGIRKVGETEREVVACRRVGGSKRADMRRAPHGIAAMMESEARCERLYLRMPWRHRHEVGRRSALTEFESCRHARFDIEF